MENVSAHVRFQEVEGEYLGTPARPHPLHDERHDADIGLPAPQIERQFGRQEAPKSVAAPASAETITSASAGIRRRSQRAGESARCGRLSWYPSLSEA